MEWRLTWELPCHSQWTLDGVEAQFHHATVPGDILKASNDKTIEVIR